MVKWLLWWIVCLLGGVAILVFSLAAVVLVISRVFWIMDSWPVTSFLVVFSGFAVAMGAVLHSGIGKEDV